MGRLNWNGGFWESFGGEGGFELDVEGWGFGVYRLFDFYFRVFGLSGITLRSVLVLLWFSFSFIVEFFRKNLEKLLKFYEFEFFYLFGKEIRWDNR